MMDFMREDEIRIPKKGNTHAMKLFLEGLGAQAA